VQTFGINETKRSGAAHAAKNCIPNFVRRSAPKTNIFAATKPNPLCAARQASTCACTFERVANEVDNNVSVIDTATNMVVATVPMGDDQEWPSRLAANKPVTLRTLATPTSLP
jgi:YVTN family beta-propeller protein